VASPTRRVFGIRHGETAWSLSGQHTGTTDIPLTDNGRRLATRLRPVLASESFALVLTSPLQHARATCELCGLGDAAAGDADLVEWNYGEFEGLTPAQIHAPATGSPRPTWTPSTASLGRGPGRSAFRTGALYKIRRSRRGANGTRT
jgi:broad specificity phosphatase PhoE